MVWYSHIFNNFPEFVVIHTVKGFGVVNKAEVDVFLEVCCFLSDPMDVGNNPLQCFCLENPRDEGAWWAVISGVAQSQT